MHVVTLSYSRLHGKAWTVKRFLDVSGVLMACSVGFPGLIWVEPSKHAAPGYS